MVCANLPNFQIVGSYDITQFNNILQLVGPLEMFAPHFLHFIWVLRNTDVADMFYPTVVRSVSFATMQQALSQDFEAGGFGPSPKFT